MSNDLIKHVTDETFEAEVLKAQGPVLVDMLVLADCKQSGPLRLHSPRRSHEVVCLSRRCSMPLTTGPNRRTRRR
ncbi:MAG: hypothetical protein ABWZ65_19625, partial [Pseudomonas mandelii]